MRARLVLAGLLLVAGAVARGDSAAARIDVVRAGTAHEAFFAVAMRDAVGVAVGAHGAVQETRDGGRSWHEQPSPTDAALLGVALLPRAALAVGQGGVVVRRDNDGRWATIESGTSNRLFAIAANEAGSVVAAGAFGTILLSSDGGEHWLPIAPEWAAFTPNGEDPHLYAVQVTSDGAITVAGEFALILRSSDAGKTWTAVHKGEASLFALQLRPDGQGYAVGQSGAVLRTDDHGVTWRALDAASDPNAIFLGVQSFADGRVIVTGMYDVVVSRDAGASWVHSGSAGMSAAWYAGVAANHSDRTAIAVGLSGSIVRVSD
jgi:photosystem II stability/assembly factor-like uncharacterized protein